MSGISICMVNYDQNCNFEKCSSIWNHYQKSFNNFDFSLPTLSMIQIYFISWSFTLILYFSVVLNFICFTFGWRWTRMCPKYAPDWLWTNIWSVTSIVLIHLVKVFVLYNQKSTPAHVYSIFLIQIRRKTYFRQFCI